MGWVCVCVCVCVRLWEGGDEGVIRVRVCEGERKGVCESMIVNVSVSVSVSV